MSRPELPEHLKKVSINITVSKDVADAAKASGNASMWFNEAGKDKTKKETKRKAS